MSRWLLSTEKTSRLLDEGLEQREGSREVGPVSD